MSNAKCQTCRGTGIIVARSGKYDKICPHCNGVGHYRTDVTHNPRSTRRTA